ncbi:cellulase family glycosylhydrolase [Rubrivirga marina]|uniref:CBM6 domain-containing protein n=1 Tax=Rubrivirga marina TaxID=1196024 RepID=A0A271IWP5_9BACT|nr:cellulase family glycosylhydrolase [Rubrivirga marina]PAP74969.1 hypothetical protein BSZ37_00145 [Rubrivirga marina]
MTRLSARLHWARLLPLATLVALATPAHAQLTPAEAAAQMGRGINLGNTLEPPQEGAWNNGPAQEHYFDDYAEAGFSTVRIPVRWDQHLGTSAPFAVDEAWMDRVEQVVDWGLERDLFVILNAHHDDWIKEDYDNPVLQARLDSLWSQVATRFQDKSDRLLFEILNEPFLPMTLADTDDMNARVLPIIRRTNPTRIVLYSGASWSSRQQLLAARIPDDPYVIGYYHSYDPYLFGLEGQGTWGSTSDRNQLAQAFQQVADWSASTGVPAILSEFGAIRSGDYNSRMRHYGAFVAGALEHGIPFQVWDDGGDFRVYERQDRDWNDVKDILISTFPDGPNRFAASLTSDTLVVLSWDAPAQSAGLVVERRFGTEPYRTVAEIDGALTAYVDTLRGGPGDYTYRVVSRTDGGPDKVSYPQRVTVVPYERAPYGGAPVALPGTIEAEDYDVGGEGLTYHDTESANIPGAYRPDEGVDLEARDDGGFQLAYVADGEWVEYTVDVAETARYEVTAYVASQDGGGLFSFASGPSFSPTFAVPQTGDWQTLAAVSQTMRLAAGVQPFRFRVDAGTEAPFNLDRIVVEALGTAAEDGPEVAAIRVFPNPARGRFTLSGVAPSLDRRVEVYDALGKLVLTAALVSAEQTVEVGGLAAGAYVLRVVDGGATLARRPLVVVR